MIETQVVGLQSPVTTLILLEGLRVSPLMSQLAAAQFVSQPPLSITTLSSFMEWGLT